MNKLDLYRNSFLFKGPVVGIPAPYSLSSRPRGFFGAPGIILSKHQKRVLDATDEKIIINGVEYVGGRKNGGVYTGLTHIYEANGIKLEFENLPLSQWVCGESYMIGSINGQRVFLARCLGGIKSLLRTRLRFTCRSLVQSQLNDQDAVLAMASIAWWLLADYEQ